MPFQNPVVPIDSTSDFTLSVSIGLRFLSRCGLSLMSLSRIILVIYSSTQSGIVGLLSNGFASVPMLTVALNMVNRLALSLGCLNRLRPAAAKATRTELPRPRPVWYIAPVFSSGNVASIVTTLTIGVSLALYDYTTLTTAHRTHLLWQGVACAYRTASRV